MSDRVRLTRKDLKVGMTVPWNIYDLEGRKLLAKGQELRSEKMLDEMCQYILFHDLPEHQAISQKSGQGKLNVFDKTNDFIDRTEKLFNELEVQHPECNDRINSLARDILSLCGREPDAVLAAVHVPNDFQYIYFHPLQCAFLSVLIARRAGFTEDECFCLAAASLVANVGMRQTQAKLVEQTEALKPEQSDIIKRHPAKCIEMLQALNYDNETVLNIILEHHERCDGSGYPQGFKRDDICRGALVLAVADSYSAMVSSSNYHEPHSIKETLQHFFMDKGTLYEAQFSLLLIKVLTVFPPGSFVKLTNGETAIVVLRGKMSPMEPLLKSVLGKNGEQYANPLVRDLSMHDFEIQSICRYGSEKPLNYSRIWDYI